MNNPKLHAEQDDRVLTPEQMRELTIDTMASWALSGMEPDRETVERINEFLESGLTAGEYARNRVAEIRAEGENTIAAELPSA